MRRCKLDKFDKLRKFDDFLEEQLQNPDFKAEYDALEPEFALMRSIMDARIESGLTQQKLSELSGISQADISRLESGVANPSLKTLQRLANAMGRKVQIKFI